MKKTILILPILFLSGQVDAQTAMNHYIDRDQIALAVTVLLVAFLLAFLLELIKRYLDYRLKEKILEWGITHEVATLLLQSGQPDLKRTCIKWFLIFLGLSCGFAIVAVLGLTMWTALAAITLCLAGSFLAYFFFLTRFHP